MPRMSTHIDLDQYESFNLNKDIPISPVHIIPINPKTNGMDTTPSEITRESLWQQAYNYPM